LLRSAVYVGGAGAVENMDKRKPVGRTVRELEAVFEELPDASFCFDIGHARQVDPTMVEAALILRTFQSRLRQLHVSEVSSASSHHRLSYGAISYFQEVAYLIPESVPLILETPVSEWEIASEIERVRKALPCVMGAGSGGVSRAVPALHPGAAAPMAPPA
jgi:endonuclease IV